MKKIRIAFTDFWDVFDPENNFIMDALRENFEVEISSDPDFVFCSIFGRRHLKYDCAKIFYTGENIEPDFNLVDYAMGFGDISFYDRYLRLPHYVLYPRACELALAKPSMSDEQLLDRKFCNYVISNAMSADARARMIGKLETYKALDSGGRYRNNVGGPVADKIDFSKGYKFSLAFENSSSRGYTTEKIVESFASSTVPIYWGNPQAAEYFDPKAFINCADYGNDLDAVIRRVEELDRDEEQYTAMLRQPPLRGDFPGMETVEFGMGCFWGAERRFWQLPGVYTTAAGYAGGGTPNPTYREVCSGRTGHAEVVRVVYDPAQVDFATLLRLFWEGHDPTQGMRQGNDVGTQYRSVIHCHTRAQYQAELHRAGLGEITTVIAYPPPPFYYAEDEHQQYLSKHPDGYCGLGGTGVACPL